jgi:DNA recombination protein RmuC
MAGNSLQITALLESYLPANFSDPVVILSLCAAVLLLTVTTMTLFFLLLRAGKKRKQALESLDEKIKEQRAAEIRTARLETLYETEKQHTREKLELLEHAREELRLQFSSLAGQIFDEKTIRFSELNHDKLNAILVPFKDQLQTLKQEINEIYRTDSRERTSLKTEISHLKELNQQINQEAANLTRALKSSTKVQGSWGELVLERVLDKSGLRKGIEYDTQSGFRDHRNRLYKPDVVVHLPEGRDIIIDSKVSLTSWEKYVNSEKDADRSRFLQELCKAIREHVQGLGNKNYTNLSGLNSLDFVLMFMPIEGAFSAACSHDSTLVDHALTNNIIIVTPTTLLATLRTVENLWHNENQSKNSLEIARRAGLMLDKFRGLLEELEKMGKQLAAFQNGYESVIGRLCKGRGNLIRQAEQLKELGVQGSKELPASMTELADGVHEELSN